MHTMQRPMNGNARLPTQCNVTQGNRYGVDVDEKARNLAVNCTFESVVMFVFSLLEGLSTLCAALSNTTHIQVQRVMQTEEFTCIARIPLSA